MKKGREGTKMHVVVRRGLICQSPASTAVCVPDDLRTMIVPRRPFSSFSSSSSSMDAFAKYSRLRGPVMDRHEPAGCTHVGCQQAQAFAHLPSPPFAQFPPPRNRRRGGDCYINMTKKQPQAAAGAPVPPLVPLAPSNEFQVVVLRVSLHCQGCAGKVKKHLSKMEGVTSFSIDLQAKRVTVMGHITPAGVLESISKVKRAELWGGS